MTQPIVSPVSTVVDAVVSNLPATATPALVATVEVRHLAQLGASLIAAHLPPSMTSVPSPSTSAPTPYWPTPSSSPLSSAPGAPVLPGIALVVAILAAYLALPTLKRSGLIECARTSWRKSPFVDVLARPG
jgi:hypothetical protein